MHRVQVIQLPDGWLTKAYPHVVRSYHVPKGLFGLSRATVLACSCGLFSRSGYQAMLTNHTIEEERMKQWMKHLEEMAARAEANTLKRSGPFWT